jgi:hypothetical protein
MLSYFTEMTQKLATVKNQQGVHVASFLKSPSNQDHDYEVIVDHRTDKIHGISAHLRVGSAPDPESHSAIKENVREFLEVIGHEDADSDLTVSK